ncbi:MAG: hypothetical protein QXN37_00785 [Candidatus Anstonellaceae archaeon]
MTKRKLPKGFTFTISILILSITLIGMALFSQEWRKSQRTAFTELLPSEIARIEEQVSSDLAAVLGTKADIRKTQSSIHLTVSSTLPFKKEGHPIANLYEYAATLPENLRNSGVEAILVSWINGSNAFIMNISESGGLFYSNDGPNDVIIYYHPLGWQPISIYATVNCSKSATNIGAFSVSGGQAGSDNLYYNLKYVDNIGTKTRFTNTPVSNHIATLQISYPDGTILLFVSNFSGLLSRNYTSISYTKSPSGALVLPLDSPASNMKVRDYSLYGLDFTVGGGQNTPLFKLSCKSQGCMEFTGNQYMYRNNFSLTETEIIFPQGSELVSNGDFEDRNGIPPNIWPSWVVENNYPEDVYIGPALIQNNWAAEISNPQGYASVDFYIYQNVYLSENSFYTLQFLSQGQNGKYSIFDRSKGKYLQADGSWDSSEHLFETGVNSDFIRITKEFLLPLGSSEVTLKFFAAESGDVIYDAVSLKQSSGLNGGFEQYYSVGGSSG